VATPTGPWFNPIAAFLGKAYWAPGTTRVQSFTTGTEQEVDFLVAALALAPGMRVLDVGCGPGRHSLALAQRGIDVLGIDLSPDFVALARENDTTARFETKDVRELDYDAEFDALICLCQGGFGLLGGDDDEHVFARFTRALTPNGRLACTAFSSYFLVRHLETQDAFDLTTGVNHERTTLSNAENQQREFDLFTTCFTPRELRLLARDAGLQVDAVHGVMPGAYAAQPPTFDHAELLLMAHRPA
jgi:ubiquinone/menaquinone biosynthesis C-methylase UbiE